MKISIFFKKDNYNIVFFHSILFDFVSIYYNNSKGLRLKKKTSKGVNKS